MFKEKIGLCFQNFTKHNVGVILRFCVFNVVVQVVTTRP